MTSALYLRVLISECADKGGMQSALAREQSGIRTVSENRLLLLPRHSVLSHHPLPIPQTWDATKAITLVLCEELA